MPAETSLQVIEHTTIKVKGCKIKVKPQSIAKYTACHAEYPLSWEMQQNNGKSKLRNMDKCNVYWNAANRLMLKKMDDSVL